MDFDKISKTVAKELGLNDHQVDQINRVQWKFLMETMQSGTFDPVHLIYLGKFYKNKRYDKGRTIRRNISGI